MFIFSYILTTMFESLRFHWLRIHLFHWNRHDSDAMAAGREYFTDAQISAAITDLKNFEEQFEHAPTAQKLLERLAVKDRDIEKIFEEKKWVLTAAKQELIGKLEQRGVETDD